MKLALVVAFALVAPSVVEARGDDPCLTLSWSGGSAGAGTKAVKARFVKLDERRGIAVIHYAHDGGEMNLRITKGADGREVLSGTWKQQSGATGSIYLVMSDKSTAYGYWTNAGKKQRHTLALRVSDC